MAIIYRPAEDYLGCIPTVRDFTAALVARFGPHLGSVRERILACSIARGITFLDSIGTLYRLEHYDCCWILHRALLERLFHIFALSEDGAYEVFFEWSFMREYESEDRLRNDPDIAPNIPKNRRRVTKQERQRYAALKEKKITWSRRRSEDIAKGMELQFLYKLGYDYGSRFVHPTGRDGVPDLKRIAGLGPEQSTELQVTVLHNSLLVQALHMQNALNASGLRWHKRVYDLVQSPIDFLHGEQGWATPWRDLQTAGKDFEWCRT